MIVLSEHNSAYDCGGKARNLITLQQLGLPVPPFVVLPAQALQHALNQTSDVVAAIHSYNFDETVISKIVAALPPCRFYSVRSSACDEDGAGFSFAGQFSSFLFVTRENLGPKIKEVWLSAYSQRVMAYRRNNGLGEDKGIAVIVQVMVEADKSGVAFGANPVNGHRKEKLISAVFGIGEGLVSGELNADTYVMKNRRPETQHIADKNAKLVGDSLNGGTIKMPVENEYRLIPVLNSHELNIICDTLDTLFNHYGTYQDIEFAFCGEVFYLLQTRPITSLKTVADTDEDFIIWDNSNIIESYPGVTTPLTFSFILPVYEAVYRQFAQLMGVKPAEVEENKETFANMLGLINGRVYYNLLSWYKALALLPGYSLNAAFMEKMMGVKERFELKNQKKRSGFKERIRVAGMVATLLKNLFALPGMRHNFLKEFHDKLKETEGVDLNKKTPSELMSLYNDFEHALLKKWKAPLVNDFFAMIYFGTLQKLTDKYTGGTNGNLHNDLLCGARDIISTEPMRLCIKITGLFSQYPALKEEIRNQPVEHFESLYHGKKLPPQIQTEISAYIDTFGNRCVGELKLETITYRQKPVLFLKIIKSYLEQEISETSFNAETESELRRKAEEKMRKALKGKFFRKFIFNYVLRQARVTVSARENLRFERTRAFGVVRELFCQIGRRFYAEGLLDSDRDIFYLSKTEISDFIKGTSVNYNLKDLVALRRAQFTAFEKRSTQERIKTHGVVYLGNDFYSQSKLPDLNGGIKGLACCPGRVRAKVQVVRDPSEVSNLNGDILVTSSTDPGWVTLFPTASGILVERGSLLSHSAIVSREMGKPCIVGITGLLEQLQSGDEVEMDGSTGIVKIIKKQTPDA